MLKHPLVRLVALAAMCSLATGQTGSAAERRAKTPQSPSRPPASTSLGRPPFGNHPVPDLRRVVRPPGGFNKPNPEYPYPTQPSVDVSGILGGVAGIVGAAISNASQPPVVHPTNPGVMVPVQPPVYVTPPPAPVYVPATVPANTVAAPPVAAPTNALPPRRTPTQPNKSLSRLTMTRSLGLTAAEAEAAATGLENQLLNDAGQFDQDQQAAERALDTLRTEVNDPTSPMTPAQRAEINAALDSGDPVALANALQNAGASPTLVDFMSKAQVEANAKRDLLNAIQSGADSATISQLGDAFLDAKADAVNAAMAAGAAITPAAAQAGVDAAAQQVNDMVATKVGAETIRDLQAQSGLASLGGLGTIGLPTGPVMVTWLPQMDAGQFVAVDPQTIFVGTGPGGVMTSGLMTPAEAGLPVVDGPQVPNAQGAASVQILLQNPVENGAPVSVLLDGQVLTLPAGATEGVPASRLSLKFDRGGGFGDAEYTLERGLYVFKLTDQGWSVVHRPTRITLDNRANPFPFQFVVRNEIREIAARETLQLTDDALCEIRFDDGQGREVRKLLESGTYSVAVNPQSQGLDLIAAEALPKRDNVDPHPSLDAQLARLDVGEMLKARPPIGSGARPTLRRSAEVTAPTVLQPPPRLQRARSPLTAAPPLPRAN